jgi:hypothetical protein
MTWQSQFQPHREYDEIDLTVGNYQLNNENKKMTKTDLVAYVSLLGTVTLGVKTLIVSAQPKTFTDWLIVVLGAISFVAFAFYDKLTSTVATPSV